MLRLSPKDTTAILNFNYRNANTRDSLGIIGGLSLMGKGKEVCLNVILLFWGGFLLQE